MSVLITIGKSKIKLGMYIANRETGQRGMCYSRTSDGKPVGRDADGKRFIADCLARRPIKHYQVRVMDGTDALTPWMPAVRLKGGRFRVDDPVFGGCALQRCDLEVREVCE